MLSVHAKALHEQPKHWVTYYSNMQEKSNIKCSTYIKLWFRGLMSSLFSAEACLVHVSLAQGLEVAEMG